jgi:hypothetical protein
VGVNNLTAEGAAKGRAAQHRTRQWYKDTLIGIFEGKIQCSSVQLNALKAFADIRGWFPPNRPKQKPLQDKKASRPQASQDVLQRLVSFNTAVLPDQSQLSNAQKQSN